MYEKNRLANLEKRNELPSKKNQKEQDPLLPLELEPEF
jgi:hypothetical protein